MKYLWFLLFPLVAFGQAPQGRLALLTNSIPIGLGLGIDFTRGVTGYASGPYIKIGLSVQSLTNQLIQTNGANLGSPSTVNYTRGLTGYVSGAVGNIGVSLADTNLLVQTNGVNVGSAGTINFIGATGAVISGVNTIGGFGGSSASGTNYDGIRVTNTVFFPNDSGGFPSELDVGNNVGPDFNDGSIGSLFTVNFEEGLVRVGNSAWNGLIRMGNASGGGEVDLLRMDSGILKLGNTSIPMWIQGSSLTNFPPFTMTTNNFVLNQYYTNSAQRSWVAAVIGLTNILATDKCQVNLYLDQDADGTWERTGIEARLQGVALMAGAEELSAFLQPNARFLFTNFSTGTATATVDANSSQWVRH